ncbi:hypothetical protein V6N11_070914 [Hibiscus sabdariffa]|uniref:Uncharacterized protein n=1 Tax=Hibiscus sabdariffa TaxID=183260 RepID=A0ABR2A3R2_9ROSI
MEPRYLKVAWSVGSWVKRGQSRLELWDHGARDDGVSWFDECLAWIPQILSKPTQLELTEMFSAEGEMVEDEGRVSYILNGPDMFSPRVVVDPAKDESHDIRVVYISRDYVEP